jgi:Fur family ferric uptake transcriptional regulator
MENNNTTIPEKTWNIYKEYLKSKSLRTTAEREAILAHICQINSHFDLDTLQVQLSQTKFTVSKATLYNTMEIFIDAGIVIKRQVTPKGKAEYELREEASKRLHLVCTKCGETMEASFNTSLFINSIKNLKAKFSPEYFSIYIYGLCHNCRKTK